METDFKDPGIYKPDDIVQRVMTHLMKSERKPFVRTSDDLLDEIGYEVFGAYDVQQIFTRHASEHDRAHAKHIGYDVYKTVAYYYGEADASKIVNRLHRRFKGKAVYLDEAAEIIKDDEIVTAFSSAGGLSRRMYQYKGQEDKVPNSGHGLDYTEKYRLDSSIGLNEDFAAFVTRRTIKPEVLLASVAVYLDDPELKNRTDIYALLCRKYKEETGLRVSYGYLQHIPDAHFSKLSAEFKRKYASAHLRSNNGQIILPPSALTSVDDTSAEVTRSFGTANDQRHHRRDRRVLTPRPKG